MIHDLDPRQEPQLAAGLGVLRARAVARVAQWDTEAQLALAERKIQLRRREVSPKRFALAHEKVASCRWWIPSIGICAAAAGLFAVMLGSRPASHSPVDHQYVTQTAQHATLDLPDGSRVLLAPATTVRFTRDTRGQRTIALHGQARFSVVHDPDRPFVVRTGDVTTTVLGTEFDVRHYAVDATVQVSVLTGKVVSSGRHASVTLTPGMVAQMTDSTATKSTDIASVIGWTNGRLAFTRTAVPAVLESIGRWYGYKFKLVDSSLAKRHVSVELSVNDRAETLQLLRELLNVTTHVQGNVIVLQPNKSSSAPPARQSERSHLQLSNEVGK